MSESEGHFKGVRGFLWLSIRLLLLAAAIGSAIYIVVSLVTGLWAAQEFYCTHHGNCPKGG
jgi:hypothetical protein